MSFRAGRDFRAGLWLSVLLLKPQYALLFGLIILWKWRPRALVGTALGALAFFSLGLAVAGSAAFFRISEALGDLADLRSEAAAWAQPAVTMRTRLGIATAAYLPTLLLIYAGGVVDRFAVPYATDVSLWYVWPDGLPVLTFLAAFVLVCRDLWRLDRPSLSTV